MSEWKPPEIVAVITSGVALIVSFFSLVYGATGYNQGKQLDILAHNDTAKYIWFIPGWTELKYYQLMILNGCCLNFSRMNEMICMCKEIGDKAKAFSVIKEFNLSDMPLLSDRERKLANILMPGIST